MTEPVIQFTIRERLQHLWIRYRRLDFGVGALLVVVWFIAGRYCWLSEEFCRMPQALTAVPPESRRAVYQIVAAAAATMGGFTLTSVSILVNLLRTPLSTIDRLLPAEDKSRVGSAFLGVLPWLLALFLAAMVCLLVDMNVPQGYWWLQLAVGGLSVSTLLAIARVVWILRRLLSVSAE
ncbi:hypothetical protein ACN27E_10690 [Mycobacterium sp. WMMD1722]|uniref:hypothetical protein n=1 Tax=Mycobacterium sp. WMMD1722 TaxID=3404117 RepID=UPI003BF48B93